MTIEIKKKSAKVQGQYAGKKFGVSMDVKPGKESYLYKSNKRRSAEVKVNSVRKFGAAKIQEAIDPLVESRTSILIAHRLSTILAADEILVIKDGVIAERGVHEELVKTGGVYTELYETQFLKTARKENA